MGKLCIQFLASQCYCYKTLPKNHVQINKSVELVYILMDCLFSNKIMWTAEE